MRYKYLALLISIFTSINHPTLAQTKWKSFINKLNIFSNDYYKSDKYLHLYNSHKGAYLLDMNGAVLKEWKTPLKRAKLLNSCNLMFIKDHYDHSIREISENGTVAWQYKAPGLVHHDFEISDDGHLHLFYRTVMPNNINFDNGCKNNEVVSDAYLEVDREKNIINEILFRDYFKEELDSDKCTKARRKRMSKSHFEKRLDWMHPNSLNILKENKWSKKGYDQFKPGNILISAHHFNRVFIFDNDLKKVVWEYSDNGRLEGQHEAKMIPKGFPGAGNILIFDNGNKRKYSRIIEINPVSKEIVWQYSDPENFYSCHSGSQQRLKNGDTFISDDSSHSRSLIVNKEGKILWHYAKGHGDTRRSKLYLKKDLAHCLNEY